MLKKYFIFKEIIKLLNRIQIIKDKKIMNFKNNLISPKI